MLTPRMVVNVLLGFVILFAASRALFLTIESGRPSFWNFFGLFIFAGFFPISLLILIKAFLPQSSSTEKGLSLPIGASEVSAIQVKRKIRNHMFLLLLCPFFYVFFGLLFGFSESSPIPNKFLEIQSIAIALTGLVTFISLLISLVLKLRGNYDAALRIFIIPKLFVIITIGILAMNAILKLSM